MYIFICLCMDADKCVMKFLFSSFAHFYYMSYIWALFILKSYSKCLSEEIWGLNFETIEVVEVSQCFVMRNNQGIPGT